MKKVIKYILIVVALAGVIALAVVGYNYLADKYQPQLPSGEDNQTADNDESPAVTLAPDFTVTDINGNEAKLSDYFGKPIVINFWATWCSPCRSELPAFNTLYRENKDNVVFLMVNLTDGYRDTVNGVKQFAAENGYSFPLFFDTTSSAADTYGVSSIPSTVFINADGSLSNTHLGAMSQQTLANYISALLNK